MHYFLFIYKANIYYKINDLFWWNNCLGKVCVFNIASQKLKLLLDVNTGLTVVFFFIYFNFFFFTVNIILLKSTA